ncbi:MAG: hypothetical protein JSS07_05855 [Proteobacteria bacterium]|nr:hypothetical protein [Pseudomonadota bacterium]
MQKDILQNLQERLWDALTKIEDHKIITTAMQKNVWLEKDKNGTFFLHGLYPSKAFDRLAKIIEKSKMAEKDIHYVENMSQASHQVYAMTQATLEEIITRAELEYKKKDTHDIQSLKKRLSNALISDKDDKDLAKEIYNSVWLEKDKSGNILLHEDYPSKGFNRLANVVEKYKICQRELTYIQSMSTINHQVYNINSNTLEKIVIAAELEKEEEKSSVYKSM